MLRIYTSNFYDVAHMEDQKGKELRLEKRRKHYAEHKELYKKYRERWLQNKKARAAKKNAVN